MKKGARLSLVMSIIVAAAFLSFGQSPYIHNTFIALPSCGTGPLPFDEIELIQTMDELNTYLSLNGCTASELAELPDFEVEVAFGVVTGYCSDHHTMYSRGMEGAVWCSDTFTLLIHGGVSVDSTRVLPLGFCAMLVTADKDKVAPVASRPLALKELPTAIVPVPEKAAPVKLMARQSATKSWDILGRSFESGLMRANSMAIRRVEDGRIVRTFAGGLKSASGR